MKIKASLPCACLMTYFACLYELGTKHVIICWQNCIIEFSKETSCIKQKRELERGTHSHSSRPTLSYEKEITYYIFHVTYLISLHNFAKLSEAM